MDRSRHDPPDDGLLREIPVELHSVYAEGPFQACAYCSVSLVDEPIPYTVEKVIHGSQTIVEIALCVACMEMVQRELSEESRAYLEQVTAAAPASREDFQCVLCGIDRACAPRYQIGGLCLGDRLLLPRVVMFCEPCADELQENLSTRTRDRLADFRDDVLDLFPDELVPEDLKPLII